jgi:Right handed beta helix region
LLTVAVGLALASTLSPAPAMAQNTRTFVSPTGNDAAACSLAAPCRTFAAAYALTNPGGEIAVLGTAGYGTVSISKAISIVNGGGFEAAIAVSSGTTGITIGAGTNDAVSLRGLTIDGGGVGNNGILFVSGQSLTIENCVIRHVTNNGIEFDPNAASNLLISNTLAADNGNAAIVIKPTGSGVVTAVMNASRQATIPR